MRTVTLWTDRLPPDGDNNKVPINAIAYRPDGAQVIAAVGMKVHVYDAALGDLLHTLRAHKDTIFCVAYDTDNKHFASGGADKTVVIWTKQGEGLLKYQHNDSIQALAFNPVTHMLVSVTATDFGFWSSNVKNVAKHKLPSKGLCVSWTSDGQHLAIGMFSGTITVRNKSGEEKLMIKRSAPVWTLAWNPVRDDGDVLCIGCWDKKLAFYHLNGKQVGRDRDLTFDPCSVSYFTGGDYLLVAGSDKKTNLFTKDGTFLLSLAEASDWVWAVQQRPKQNAICVASNDGIIATYQLVFNTVHSIFQEQYVYRDMMTDVIIQLLTVDRKLRIPCRDYVRKVAIYRDRLAVQLNERIIVYELFYDDQYDLKYRVKERINKKLECSLLCVTSSNVILCQDKRLTSYDFTGQKRREWIVDAVIRYIKVVGGLTERESLLIGLKNGAVEKIFIDNAFPTTLVKLNVPIRCLDLSPSRTKLAVVDDNSNCLVYEIKTKELLWSESDANAVAWNTDHEDIICFSGKGTLNIKTGQLAPYQQRLQGFVVGFKGNKVFCLHSSNMITVDVPHSHALHRYVEKRDFEKAYQIACLGVTEDDWKMLGMHAMQALKLDIARKAFIRVREVKFVELLNRVELDRRVSGGDDAFLLGDILAFQGKYHEAAACFVKAHLDGRAIEMFCDMKMWDEARKICTNEDHLKDLIRRQAMWAEETGDNEEASKLWLAAGDFGKAIRLMGDAGNVEQLVEVCRTLPKTDTKAISQCGAFFRDAGAFAYAVEAYQRINDSQALLKLYVDMGHWTEAFALLDLYPQYTADVYVPYAAWLATNDRFEEAQEAFLKAKRPQDALRMMEQLAANSVIMRRFTDAGFYFFKLAQDTVSAASIEWEAKMIQEAKAAKGGPAAKAKAAAPQFAPSPAKKKGTSEFIDQLTEDDIMKRVQRHDLLVRKAELYYAYEQIYRYNSNPFTVEDLAQLFNAARYLLAVTAAFPDIPMNISKLEVLLALGRLTTALDMFRLARQVHERLQQFIIPTATMEQLDIATLVMRGRPFNDREDLLPSCHRCGQQNSSLSAGGDRCSHCGHPFIRSFHSFEVLPLVEFVLADDISDYEAERIIFHGGGVKSRLKAGLDDEEGGDAADAWSGGGGSKKSGADVMTFGDELVAEAMGEGGDADADPFAKQVMAMELEGALHGAYRPVVCNRNALSRLKSDDVFIVKRQYSAVPIAWQFFRNINPGAGITLCETCSHFFSVEDYELESLKNGGGCPFCRTKPSA